MKKNNSLENPAAMENMELKTAMTVIMDSPLSSLVELDDDAEAVVFGELQVSDMKKRKRFTFRKFIDVYPRFIKMPGMTMGGYVRGQSDIYIELTNTIAHICEIFKQAEHMDTVRQVRDGVRQMPGRYKDFMKYAQRINAINVLCSMPVTDYFAKLKDIYQIGDELHEFCNKLLCGMNSNTLTVKNLLIMARVLLPEDTGYRIFEDLILAPFSIALMHEKADRQNEAEKSRNRKDDNK
ncbi:MAG: hypothetical protein ACI4JA_03515 [Oscillospiraceae bacterium]